MESKFHPAENEHQRYLENNPYGYCNHGLKFKWEDYQIPKVFEEEQENPRLTQIT